MATLKYVLGLTDIDGSQFQTMIPCNSNGILYSTDSATDAQFKQDFLNFTANGLQVKGNATNTAPPAGYIGERIETSVSSGSAVSVSNGSNTNIMSISLTAGVWDVSAVLAIQGILTGSSLSGSISTTSATGGTAGDNLVQVGLLNLSANQMLTVPSYRLLLSATTTVYLVANASFTLGTASCFGRLSAVRAA